MIATLHGSEIRFDRWAHNAQRGTVEKNGFKFCLFLSSDPSDDWLNMPGDRRHETFNDNPFGFCDQYGYGYDGEPSDEHDACDGIEVRETVDDDQIEGYHKSGFAVFVSGVRVSRLFTTALRAWAEARAVAEYATAKKAGR